MENFDDLHEITLNKAADTLSIILQSFNTKDERLTALLRIEPTPKTNILKRVLKRAEEREDFETCDALKEFLGKNT